MAIQFVAVYRRKLKLLTRSCNFYDEIKFYTLFTFQYFVLISNFTKKRVQICLFMLKSHNSGPLTRVKCFDIAWML